MPVRRQRNTGATLHVLQSCVFGRPVDPGDEIIAKALMFPRGEALLGMQSNSAVAVPKALSSASFESVDEPAEGFLCTSPRGPPTRLLRSACCARASVSLSFRQADK